MNARSAKEVWQAALGELQIEVSAPMYRTYLKDTVGLSYHGDQFIVAVASTFTLEGLDRNLKPLVKKTLHRITGQSLDVQFQVYQERAPSPATAYPWGQPKFNPRYTFSSFIVGGSNRLAHAAALGVAEKPGASYNPLFIYGGVGLGKTHLLHAIGHVALRVTSKVIYVTAEQFTNEFIAGLRERRIEDFDNKYRNIDILLIDDVHFFAGKQETQEKLFHTFNDLHNANRQIVLSSDRPPKALALLEDRLRSRFEWGLIADIQPPDLETRVAILQAKAEEQRAKVSPEVAYLIARRIPSNIRELEGALNRVVAYAQLTHSILTPELATQALTEVTAMDFKRTLTPELIISMVAEHFELDPEIVRGKRRDRPISLARQVAMYLLREELQCGWTEIGRELGGKDHKAAVYGHHKIASEVDANYALHRELLQIKDRLYSQST